MRSLHRTLVGVLTLVLPASLAATFDVRMSSDTTRITLKADGRVIETTDIKVEPKQILFTFAPGGDTIRCTLLLRDDKSYSGDCLDSNGGKGVIVMRPPKS